MERVLMTLKIIVPIFAIVGCGIFAKKRAMLSSEQISGLQQFVVKFGIPCILFNSCFSANINAESITSMMLVIPMLAISSIVAFLVGRKYFPYHNFPMLFSAQETGMLGIPLFVTLFGTSNAYRIGMLDLAQSFIAIPAIAILASDTKGNLSLKDIINKVLKSPLLLVSILGLSLNLSGIAAYLDVIGVKEIITETVNFISEPVSATMLFCVGYNFSISQANRKIITKISLIHLVVFMVFGALMQGLLFLLEDVNILTRYATLLYCILPGSYLSPSLGRNEQEYVITSGVCSFLTIITLAIFCITTVLVA